MGPSLGRILIRVKWFIASHIICIMATPNGLSTKKRLLFLIHKIWPNPNIIFYQNRSISISDWFACDLGGGSLSSWQNMYFLNCYQIPIRPVGINTQTQQNQLRKIRIRFLHHWARILHPFLHKTQIQNLWGL